MDEIPFLSLKDVNGRLREEIDSAIRRVLDSGSYIRGAECEAFESEFAGYCGTKHAVGVGNGLDALILTLKAYIELGRIPPGSEVIVPSNTFIATILAVSEAGLVPALVEPRIETANIDPGLIERSISGRTSAILAVHLYGRAAEAGRIREIADRRGLLFIEDAAQAHGAAIDGRRVGSFGDAACFSFYPGKNLGGIGDGGAVTTDDDGIARMVRMIANYGSEEKYVHALKGVNSRLDEIQAAVLRIRLARLNEDNERRRKIAADYIEGIKNPRIELPIPGIAEECVWHLFVIRCDARDDVAAFLASRGIQTGIHYPTPPHRQGAYHEWADRSYPVAESIHTRALSLPMSPCLTDEEVSRIVDAINCFDGAWHGKSRKAPGLGNNPRL